jgi:CubicO group peptidase (beta-lactamase class C family)
MMTLYGRFLLTIATALLLDWQVMLHAQNPSGRLAERFRELDTDQNGVLSLTESGREKAVFDEIDANKDGELTLREVGDYLRGGGKLRPITTPNAPPKEIVGEFTAAMPVSLRSCRAATEYSRRSGGHAVLVRVAGATVYENYHNGWSVEAAHRLASGTKSFAGVAAAVAVDEGLFDFDDPVSETIPQWKDDPRLSLVTIRQLLSLTSGIDPGDNSIVLPYGQAIQATAKHRPGTKFEYGPNPFQVFGDLMRRRVPPPNRSMLDYLQQRVFEPIGLEIGQWRQTRDGDPHVPSGAFLTAREWAKFGELLRQGGRSESRQIVRANLLKELLIGTKANPRYGMTFWLNIKGGVGAGDDAASRSTTPTADSTPIEDLFMAAGAGKQRLYVIPSLQLTVVRFGESQGRQYRDDVFLKRLIVNR